MDHLESLNFVALFDIEVAVTMGFVIAEYFTAIEIIILMPIARTDRIVSSLFQLSSGLMVLHSCQISVTEISKNQGSCCYAGSATSASCSGNLPN
jgi:hypothetical protein